MKIRSSTDWKEVEEYKMKREKEEERVSAGNPKLLRLQWPLALLFISISVSVILVLFKWVALDLIIEQQVYQQVRLEEGSDTWEKWVNVPIPVFIKFRFFNLTNYDQFEKGAKPRVEEVGPYTYEEKRFKKILAVDKEQDTVRYRQPIYYYFRQDLSVGDESDRVILVNIPFVSVAKISRQMTNLELAYSFTDRNLRDRGERLFNRYTIRQYLFDGFPVNSFVNFLSSPMVQLIGTVTIPESFNGSRFGFYKGRNGSDDGEMVVSSGTRVPNDFGKILSWEGKTRLDLWEGNCNLINGTDGSIFRPFIKKSDLLRFYAPELCRSLVLIYVKEVSVKGIKGYRFQLPHPKYIFEHKDFCFCPPKPKSCLKQGVFDLSPCRDGAPVSFSAPHFFQSWEPYLKSIDGLNPSGEKHDTFVDVEPTTGLLLRAIKRLQFNVEVEPNPSMQTFRRVPRVLLPFMWVEEAAEIPDYLAEEIKLKLYVPVQMANKATIGGLLACSIFTLVGIVGYLYVKYVIAHSDSLVDSVDRESQDSSSGIHSIVSSVSQSQSVVSRGTNTDEKETMTDQLFKSDK